MKISMNNLFLFLFLFLFLPQLAFASSYCNSLSALKRNLTIETDYKYDFHEFYVPERYKTEFNKDLFGNVYAETKQVSNGYTGSSVKAIYVSVKLTNECLNRVKFRYQIKAVEKKQITNTLNTAVGGLLALTLLEVSPEMGKAYVKSENFQEQMGYVKQKLFDIEIDSGESEYTVGKVPLMAELINAPEVTVISMEGDTEASTEEEINNCEVVHTPEFCKEAILK